MATKAEKILAVEERRVRYFLENAKISEGGIANVIDCFKEAHARVLAETIRVAGAELHDSDPITEVGMRAGADCIDPDVAP